MEPNEPAKPVVEAIHPESTPKTAIPAPPDAAGQIYIYAELVGHVGTDAPKSKETKFEELERGGGGSLTTYIGLTFRTELIYTSGTRPLFLY